jgi:hypothetical protein
MKLKVILKYLVISVTVFGVWLGLSSLWFELWIWGRLPYPPKMVRHFFDVDGEGAYDLVATDMQITVIGLMLIFFLLFLRWRKANQ